MYIYGYFSFNLETGIARAENCLNSGPGPQPIFCESQNLRGLDISSRPRIWEVSWHDSNHELINLEIVCAAREGSLSPEHPTLTKN